MAKKTKSSAGKVVGVAAGIAALGAAAYLLFGPEGKKHQKNLKSWMLKMKAEVMEKMEKAGDLTAASYADIVNQVEAKYKTLKNVDGALLAKEAAELKKNWRAMAKKAKGKVVKQVKKVSKK